MIRQALPSLIPGSFIPGSAESRATVDWGTSERLPHPSSRPEPPSSGEPPSQEARRPLGMARSLAAATRRAAWEEWGSGWRCGPDSPPGVGWKLTKRGQSDRFYRDRGTALAKWTEMRPAWEAEGQL